MMDKHWSMAKDGRYICPVCNERFDEDLLLSDKFYAYAKYLNEAAGEQWDKMVQSALNNPIAKDIHFDWVWTGPGPDPRGEEGDCGPGVTEEAEQCGDASGRGND